MILVDRKWNGGLFDYDEDTHTLSKVLKMYRNNDEIYFSRFEYTYYPNDYATPRENDIEKHKHYYFNDNGNLVFK